MVFDGVTTRALKAALWNQDLGSSRLFVSIAPSCALQVIRFILASLLMLTCVILFHHLYVFLKLCLLRKQQVHPTRIKNLIRL